MESNIAPGQFVAIKVNHHFLRRPISICDWNQDSITVIYEIRGIGTADLAKYQPGDQLDILGPLGNGYNLNTVEQGAKILVVGGGIGVPPLLGLGKELSFFCHSRLDRESQVDIDFVFGYRTSKQVILEQEFNKLGNVKYATEDGSLGTKGYVTDVIETGAKYDFVFACGPTPMLKALQGYDFAGAKVQLSLEERMGCCVGACYGCVVKTAGGSYKRVCLEGPVVNGNEVLI
jgi:dihydroorotate dehydrogenase electron transfer subunit